MKSQKITGKKKSKNLSLLSEMSKKNVRNLWDGKVEKIIGTKLRNLEIKLRNVREKSLKNSDWVLHSEILRLTSEILMKLGNFWD